MKAKELDQWFTQQHIADRLVNTLWRLGYLRDDLCVVEPSAGAGSFVRALRSSNRLDVLAYDIDPHPDLPDTVVNDWLAHQVPCDVVVGNPPYGHKGALATKFINASLTVADTVAFIVPVTLSTSFTAQRHVDASASLVYEEPIPDGAFLFEGRMRTVPSVFQVWTRLPKDLRLTPPALSHPDFDMRIYNKTAGARKWLDGDWDVAIPRNSKRPVPVRRDGPDYEVAEVEAGVRHWMLITTTRPDVTDRLMSIDWTTANDGKMTAGIGRAEVVELYRRAVKCRT